MQWIQRIRENLVENDIIKIIGHTGHVSNILLVVILVAACGVSQSTLTFTECNMLGRGVENNV